MRRRRCAAGPAAGQAHAAQCRQPAVALVLQWRRRRRPVGGPIGAPPAGSVAGVRQCRSRPTLGTGPGQPGPPRETARTVRVGSREEGCRCESGCWPLGCGGGGGMHTERGTGGASISVRHGWHVDVACVCSRAWRDVSRHVRLWFVAERCGLWVGASLCCFGAFILLLLGGRLCSGWLAVRLPLAGCLWPGTKAHCNSFMMRRLRFAVLWWCTAVCVVLCCNRVAFSAGREDAKQSKTLANKTKGGRPATHVEQPCAESPLMTQAAPNAAHPPFIFI